jgi:hypothetical protein
MASTFKIQELTMRYRIRLLKLAIRWTPKIIVVWAANIVLKNIAELTDFSVDLDARTTHTQVLLAGENEAIDVWLDGFAVLNDGENYHFFIQNARSNKLWLSNALAHIVGKNWKIPVTPQLKAPIGLVAELLKPESPALPHKSPSA